MQEKKTLSEFYGFDFFLDNKVGFPQWFSSYVTQKHHLCFKNLLCDEAMFIKRQIKKKPM